MKIISHRGFWLIDEEKNTKPAFVRSFSLGYGTETDIRDYKSNLVVSHDIADENSIRFIDLLEMASRCDNTLTLALNVKADGLAKHISELIKNYPALDCFVFDMSVPDTRSYFDEGVPVFTRMSEVEKEPVWLDKACGVWLDAFESEWYTTEDIKAVLAQGKRICVVSSELHKRDKSNLWNNLLSLRHEKNLILCTDLPEDAQEFFFKK
ncbi:phosphodiesterase [Yersinia enterocolitica]|uniref:Phosphodiesterase n=1 Tax=Yersinia enterocolitica TaxID=630 RepID=A0A0H5H833_YEREN|nr:hypothetical protein [Yersinia enterocolitica]EKN3331953.1 phosphodiesterase [Yersinia enterocolitica]EKN3412616.1 phosphodiesterase [Yersinia enterocolitica]EKN3494226.1 phosphodiesterase [Yersinia enterocolitica]EKN3510517.1 phosphodiesterase [Yersinia enterocolitica]EKN3555150.1 phosphodiesterase [Yersinia enterocolitica]